MARRHFLFCGWKDAGAASCENVFVNRKWIWIVIPALAAGSWLIGFVWDHFDQSSIAHVAVREWIRLLAQAEYEFHSSTGRWPKSADDLAQTSLPLKMPGWRAAAANIRFFWRDDLQPDPKDNAGILLMYYDAGTISRLGKRWVCWGDLRTEYLSESEIAAAIRSQSGSAAAP